MYDFYFGTPAEIALDEKKFLLAIKRMMPRWVNSIPDSEFLALAEILDELGSEKSRTEFAVVETGVGASSLVMAFYAMKYDGMALSWDFNGEKGSVIRTVCTETFGNYFGKHIDKHWKHVAYHSLSPHLGLPIVGELVGKVDLFFHDSDHVWNTVRGELAAVMPFLRDGSVVALDDANQDYLHTNIGYVNTFRRKLGLPPVEREPDNLSETFYVAAEKFLKDHWEKVDHLEDIYKKQFSNDPYFAYYDAEFQIKSSFGTERTEKLQHRFDSWRVANRRNRG